MVAVSKSTNSYFDLIEHNFVQIILYFFFFVILVTIIFWVTLPLVQNYFEVQLKGEVINNGTFLSMQSQIKSDFTKTSYLFNWAIDLNKKSDIETRVWFNPFISFFLPISVIAFMLSTILSALMPRKLGYMSQKIEREILKTINKIASSKFGVVTDSNTNDIIHDILNLNIRNIRDFAEMWDIKTEDLEILHKAVKWHHSSTFYKILHVNDGIRMYMRFYFTVKYSGSILGAVYMGAAVLIIIVGLRGLKFIPPSRPSLVLFALGLEFSMLILYAFTLIYSRQEEESEFELNSSSNQIESLVSTNQYGNAKEIENLLRVFLKTKDKN